MELFAEKAYPVRAEMTGKTYYKTFIARLVPDLMIPIFFY